MAESVKIIEINIPINKNIIDSFSVVPTCSLTTYQRLEVIALQVHFLYMISMVEYFHWQFWKSPIIPVQYKLILQFTNKTTIQKLWYVCGKLKIHVHHLVTNYVHAFKLNGNSVKRFLIISFGIWFVIFYWSNSSDNFQNKIV